MAEETTPNTAENEAPLNNQSTDKPVDQAPAGKTAGDDAPPSTVEEQAPSVVSEHLHSTTEAEATDIPTANAPDPTAANPEVNPNAAGEKSSTAASSPDDTASAQPEAKKTAKAAKADKPAASTGDKPAAKADKPAAAAGDKPAAKGAKKEKAPAVEDKPFAEFIQQDYLPALQKALASEGVQDLDLTFAKQKVPIANYNQNECWQVIGRWQKGVQHQFNIYFPEENIQGQRAFSCNEGSKPSTLEPFLIDERKVNLDLMVFGVTQRLNGQKWLTRN